MLTGKAASRRTVWLITGCVAILVLSASSALAGSLGEQVQIKPPAKSPVTVPGAHLKKGERLKSAELLIEQPFTIDSGEKLVATFTCPGRKKNAGLAFTELSKHIAIDLTRYERKTQKVTLKASRNPSGQSYSGSVFSRCAVHRATKKGSKSETASEAS